MPYYECPVCGGGYVIDPAPAHPTCDRDGAALKRASEESYLPSDPPEETKAAPAAARAKKSKR
jgi:hypothetical protein